MTVNTVGADDVIVFTEDGNSSNGQAFLSDVSMAEPTDFSLLIGANRAFLETTYPHHEAVEVNFFVGF